MNKTCLESGDQPGLTQQPSVVSWMSCGCGVGVIVGVGDGATVEVDAGAAARVGTAVSVGASVATSIDGELHAPNNTANNPIKLNGFIPHPSCFILYRRYQSGGHGFL
jgi:hypothetical protein